MNAIFIYHSPVPYSERCTGLGRNRWLTFLNLFFTRSAKKLFCCKTVRLRTLLRSYIVILVKVNSGKYSIIIYNRNDNEHRTAMR